MKIYFLIWFIVTSVVAEIERPDIYSSYDVAFHACGDAMSEVGQVCPEEHHGRNLGEVYSCYCGTDAGFGTLADCYVQGYNNNTEIIDTFIDLCRENANISMSHEQFWNNYSRTVDLQQEPPKKLEDDEEKHGRHEEPDLLEHPYELDWDYFENVKIYNYYDQFNKNWSIYYGSALMGYFLVIIIISAITNWTLHLFPSITKHFAGHYSNAWRRYFTLRATHGRRKTSAWGIGFIMPSRFESVVIFFFYFLSALFCGLDIKVDPGHVMEPVSDSLSSMVAKRTGIIAGFVFPLLVLFAGRNNFVQWVTRWNFATYITYHRWVARVCSLLIIVHAITFSLSDSISGVYYRRMKEEFMIWGTVGCICGGFILVQGLLYFRRKSYELFLILHILLAFFFILGGYYHTVDMGYGIFYLATFAAWAFDRVIRIARILTFGAPKASVTLLAEETLRVVIPKPKYWKATPGGHAFIHFLRPACFWQSHPFTFTDASEDGNAIIMYIKLKGGITNSVYKHLINMPGKLSSIRVLVEGPYGEASSAKVYKNAIFVAGGNGIPGIYSECIDIARRKKSDTPRLKLIWVIREWRTLSWFYKELKKLNEVDIDTTIYVTRPEIVKGLDNFSSDTEVLDSSSSLGDKHQTVKEVIVDEEKNDELDDDKLKGKESSSNGSVIENIKQDLNHIVFEEGRPDIEDYVKQEIANTDGSLAFVTCGHPVMVDDIRYSVASNLNHSKHRIEFFEQLQVWA